MSHNHLLGFGIGASSAAIAAQLTDWPLVWAPAVVFTGVYVVLRLDLPGRFRPGRPR